MASGIGKPWRLVLILAAALLVGTLAVALLTGKLSPRAEQVGRGAAASASVSPTPEPAPSCSKLGSAACDTPTAAPRPLFGVTLKTGSPVMPQLKAVTAAVKAKPDIAMTYVPFDQPFPAADLTAISDDGVIPLVTWEPWHWGDGIDQPDFSLAQLTNGSHDAYLTQWAEALRDFGRPVQVRFAHEMNGNWTPWGDGVNGNSGRDFVRAWRHVHDVVQAAGAARVQWVWSPNIAGAGAASDLARFYPGQAYVDVVGLDGYNWGTTPSGGGVWREPQTVFGAGIQSLRTIAPGKPILITETSSSETGGSKAEWISELVSYLAGQRDVLGFVWFDQAKERQWQIDSSPQSVAALARALAARR